ncbi:pyrroline-5-carboxylate reductase [Poriferisphaera sp. WC338]|uniref:pyrroline-5-carboxylate reductase n=1 Tax=Poriferisphaera sp. WC338 TaxID=3425129 RepID=UPI003D814DED
MSRYKYTLGFIGAGNMAEAIAQSAIESGVVDSHDILAADLSADRLAIFEAMGTKTTPESGDVAEKAEQVILAFKPQSMAEALPAIAERFHKNQIVISIMAGIGSEKIADCIKQAGGPQVKVVRVMPNTPIMVGRGMAGIATGAGAGAEDDQFAMQLFSAANNKAVRVTEDQLHDITAVSGSGPAYVFFVAEAMQKAAEKLGLGPMSDELVAQTLLGASQLLSESNDSAAELRQKVTSPKGTTEAAINSMDAGGLTDVIGAGMAACRKRSVELGKTL